IISKFVAAIRDRKSLNILDVGGKNGRLNDFLPGDNVFVLDVLPPSPGEDNYVHGSILVPPFRNGSFDVVVSSDVLEHIPPTDRNTAILEMLRLSKNFVVLGAPFYSEDVKDAEERANNFFVASAGISHPWLEEHIRNGLPSKSEFETFLQENGYEFTTVNSNNLHYWLILQYFIFSAYLYGIPEDDVNAVYRYYNENYVELGDFQEPTYRTLYLIGKRGTVPGVESILSETPSDPHKQQELLSLVFKALGGINQRKETHITNLEGIIADLRSKHQSGETELAHLRSLVQARDVRISDLEDAIEDLHSKYQSDETELAHLRSLVQARDSHISDLEGVIEDLRSKSRSNEVKLARLESLVQEKDIEIESVQNKVDLQSKDLKRKDEEIVQLSSTLSAIQNSTTWIMVTKFHALVERLMPLGTRRRHFYDLGIISLRILAHEGPGSLWVRGKDRLTGKFPLKSVNTSTRPILSVPVAIYDGNVPLALDTPLTGQFISSVNRLNAIEVLTGTYERRNADLRLSIREGSLEGPVIRDVVLKGSRIVNNGYSRWEFKPILDSKGKTYYFQIVSTGSPSAAVWYNPTAPHEKLQLFRDGKEINGRIGFQCFTKEAIRDPYELWILQNEPSETQLAQMRDEDANFSYRPKISIVTPVWNTDERWLRRAIESVLEQTYDNWELCIVDGGSTKESVGRVLKAYAEKDSRIKVKILGENKGISGNSNEALSLATGEFVGLLDHDDELAPFALYEVVEFLNENKNVSFIYSDEDKIDDKGRRNNPFFKPDWSPDMFLSHNYLCHFSVIRREIVQRVGGFREGYDGSQDYDLFLRVTEVLDKREIGHIPKILYHWRMIPGSAADTIEAKPYAIVAAKLALTDAMRRRGIKASVVDGLFLSSYRVRYEITGNPRVSIIVPTKDKVGILQTCVTSILKMTDYENYEIVIVDNQSREPETHDYYQRIKNNPHIKVLEYNSPFNFSAINNFAVAHADGEYLVLLNNDTEIITREWLTAMLEHAQREEVGAVGAKLLYYNNTIQHAGVVLGITGSPGEKGVAGHSHKHLSDRALGYFLRPHIIGNVSAVTAACMMVRKNVYEEVGGLEEDLVVAFNDVDFCLKIREKGYLIVYTPYAKLYHYESLSRGYEDNPEKQTRFLKEVRHVREKWGDYIDTGDPYYNPNLTL
ncbi:MAG TPA: glycosyltransferase, partial [Methanoculleus thermophilus]|nr:glycosyltransferase [Methanoculleus thermophilus]